MAKVPTMLFILPQNKVRLPFLQFKITFICLPNQDLKCEEQCAVNSHYEMFTVDASMCDIRRLATKLAPNEKLFVVTEKQTVYC